MEPSGKIRLVPENKAFKLARVFWNAGTNMTLICISFRSNYRMTLKLDAACFFCSDPRCANQLEVINPAVVTICHIYPVESLKRQATALRWQFGFLKENLLPEVNFR